MHKPINALILLFICISSGQTFALVQSYCDADIDGGAIWWETWVDYNLVNEPIVLGATQLKVSNSTHGQASQNRAQIFSGSVTATGIGNIEVSTVGGTQVMNTPFVVSAIVKATKYLNGQGITWVLSAFGDMRYKVAGSWGLPGYQISCAGNVTTE